MTLIPASQAQEPLVLALDLGTTSTRAVILDGQGRTLDGLDSRRANHIEMDITGAFTANPTDLLEGVWQCLDEVLQKAGPLAAGIRGVCCCTFVSNVMGLAADGKAITPLVLYGDTRAAPQAAELRQRLDEERFHQRTGTYFHSSYLPARFLWWQAQDPHAFTRVQRWMSIGEYLLLQLFGSTAASYSVASWTGLLNRASLDWDDELLAALPVRREQLSGLVDAGQPWQGLREPFARRWPALAHTPWFPAIGDGAAANLGSGCATPDRVAISMGTSSAVRVVIPGPGQRVPGGLWCYRVDARRSLLGGALTEGGSIYAWFRRILNFEGVTDLESALAKIPPVSHGLTFLPLVSGERSPGWVAEARGAITGLSLATSPVDLLRAGLEAVACRIALIYELLRPSLPGDPEIIASGGAIQSSPVWQGILADALNRPVRLSQVPETSTRGAVLLALEALGAIADAARLPDFSVRAAEPNPEHHARYREMIEQQQRLYAKLIVTKNESGLR